MKKFMLMVMVTLVPMLKITAQNDYSTDKGFISFFSEAPVADVDAKNKKVKAELNTTTHELIFTLAMSDFQFENKKMGRDAEKKYLETEKYPQAGFKGKINGSINYDKPGSYPVEARGKLKIHGVEKEVSEKGTVIVEQGHIKLRSEFHVALKDYNIETPSILGQEMTKDDILVKVEITLSKQSKQASRK
jgi:hypothetical protein